MIAVTPFEAYKKYVALKLHFSSDRYDYFKFKGDVKVSKDALEKRNDKFFFHRLAKQYKPKELEMYLVANFLENPQNWVGDILDPEGDEVYKRWQKKIQSLTYSFKEDIKTLKDIADTGFQVTSFDELFECVNGEHPYLLWLVLHKEISLETFIIMNKILHFFPQFDKHIKQPLVWQEFKQKCLKYEPFLSNVDVKKFKNIMKDILIA